MSEQLTVKDEILISASPEKVWEVLIKPKYIAQWDELPENYPEKDMQVGSKVIWDLPNGGPSVTTIIKAEAQKELMVSLNVTSWEVKPNEGDVAYKYQLEEKGGRTLLKIDIGDFSLIQNGQMYYDASVDFAANAKKIIKDLAEN
jgi:uncharacterized protein YndB with AHSA1/START domain